MKVKLVVRGGKLAGQEIPVRTAQFVIGRDETCNLRPASNMVSKLHCALVTSDDALWARDLKSTNGTYVNGARIDDRIQLKHGDEIRVGPLALEVRIADEPKATKVNTTVKSTKGAPSKKAVEEDDVCDWLSEEEVQPVGDELSESPTIMDLALNTETVSEMDELNSASPKAPGKKKTEDSKQPTAGSSAAASNILQNFFVRRRSSG